MNNARKLVCAFTCLAPLFSSPASALADGNKTSTFAIIGENHDGATVLTAKSSGRLLDLSLRPTSSIVIDNAIPTDVAVSFGAKKEIPFSKGLQLHGWPEQPGLYCDLLRPRGLGLSSACLRDTNRDGNFDEGVRLDFNSARSDILLISHSGKVIGAKFKKTVPLPKPVPYSEFTGSPNMTGKVSVMLKSDFKMNDRDPSMVSGTISIDTPDNHTGTEGLSEQVMRFQHRGKPVDLDVYGVKLRLIDFDATGALRYSILEVKDGAHLPLLFRGYVIYTIGY